MRPRFWIGTFLAAAAVATLGSIADPLPEAKLPLPIPAADRQRPNPVEATDESVETGRKVFASQCSMCHGANGDGNGALVERLGLSVPDFTRPGYGESRTDGDLFWLLTHGHDRMPGEGDRLSEETKWHLVNAIRSMGRPAAG